jgi:hypothetical protein
MVAELSVGLVYFAAIHRKFPMLAWSRNSFQRFAGSLESPPSVSLED